MADHEELDRIQRELHKIARVVVPLLFILCLIGMWAGVYFLGEVGGGFGFFLPFTIGILLWFRYVDRRYTEVER